MKSLTQLLPRTLIVSTLILAQGLAVAGPRHYDPPRHHHHHRHGLSIGGALLGLAIAVPLIAIAHRAAEREADVIYTPPPAPLPPPAPVVIQQQPVPPLRGEPIIYPRNGQSAEQLEFDRRECNRWATTQPSAMNDASVFNRAVDACMDGRGYTLR
ncbi:hypothetical protein [Pelomonas sp. SE-A7]|uniref:hypothetical protein n=1 Tax=Pelomonas sp. SE-A7 TaxID=3054953 RepID=UPI00259D031E|nr:hypothetical protein [Pelomonas sp. SE-A7]MDM4768191.1 hypothetical protein [Pelomonas sp. SE-A7]